jgi:hypothetical protein
MEALKPGDRADLTITKRTIRSRALPQKISTCATPLWISQTAMASLVNSAIEADKAKSRRYSAEEWEVQKINVERLYVTEDRPLKEVIQDLKQEFGFIAT